MSRAVMRTLGVVLLLVVGSQAAIGQAPSVADSSPLQEYLAQRDTVFDWKLLDSVETPLGKYHDVELTSQSWMDMTWKHILVIYEPTQLKHREHALLFITGGAQLNKPREGDRLSGLMIAQMCGARVAMLHQVPNQPLLGGRKEDDLITDTFLFHLATGDKRWPLLFPMVKSAVRAMDCVEQLAAKEWNQQIKGFVVTGASKRGWTTWLTGASDKRVIGIAPIVIDALNFKKQMEYQLETWGKYSEQIDDYERKGLIKHLQQDPNFPLWSWVDPWFYRSQISVPKLIINGTNDRYWTVDALNNYWDDISGPKFIRYVPNAGHNLQGGPGSREAAMATLGAFFQHTVEGKSLPAIVWKHETAGGVYKLQIQPASKPTAVRLWSATSQTKDFRQAEWDAKLIEEKDGAFIGVVAKPQAGHVALYGEIQFNTYGIDYSLSTQIRRE